MAVDSPSRGKGLRHADCPITWFIVTSEITLYCCSVVLALVLLSCYLTGVTLPWLMGVTVGILDAGNP